MIRGLVFVSIAAILLSPLVPSLWPASCPSEATSVLHATTMEGTSPSSLAENAVRREDAEAASWVEQQRPMPKAAARQQPPSGGGQHYDEEQQQQLFCAVAANLSTPLSETTALLDSLRHLRRTGGRIVTAESLTAGAVAAAIVDPVGFGSVLYGGFVTYHEDAKFRHLGVTASDVYTADAACQMAQGALRSSSSIGNAHRKWAAPNIAIALTGHAGPVPNPRDLGVVHIAVSVSELRSPAEAMTLLSCASSSSSSSTTLPLDPSSHPASSVSAETTEGDAATATVVTRLDVCVTCADASLCNHRLGPGAVRSGIRRFVTLVALSLAARLS